MEDGVHVGVHVRAEDGVKVDDARARGEGLLPRAPPHVARDDGLAVGLVPQTVIPARVEAGLGLVHDQVAGEPEGRRAGFVPHGSVVAGVVYSGGGVW